MTRPPVGTNRVVQATGTKNEVDRLRRDCADLYQVIGVLAESHGDLFDHPEVIKALDNASAAANGDPRPHDDLLPFAPLMAPASVKVPQIVLRPKPSPEGGK
jgi:hypothetical protein